MVELALFYPNWQLDLPLKVFPIDWFLIGSLGMAMMVLRRCFPCREKCVLTLRFYSRAIGDASHLPSACHKSPRCCGWGLVTVFKTTIHLQAFEEVPFYSLIEHKLKFSSRTVENPWDECELGHLAYCTPFWEDGSCFEKSVTETRRSDFVANGMLDDWGRTHKNWQSEMSLVPEGLIWARKVLKIW